MLLALYSELPIFVFFHFCTELAFRNGRKSGYVMLCYGHKWIGKKEVSAKISKCLYRNLFIGTATEIRAVYKDHEILVTFKRCITLYFTFLDRYTQIFYCFIIVVLTKIFFVYLMTVQIRPNLLIWKWTARTWG